MRTRRALALFACLSAAAPGAASAAPLEVTARTKISPRLTELTMRTPSLDFPARVRVLLPDGYGANRKRRYPVLYLLHGSFDTSAGWTVRGAAERLTAGLPLIVVMPPAAGKGNAGGWASDWHNEGRGGTPRWETFTIRELLPWVDRNLRTVPRRSRRAIAGLSMGGFSAMSYAVRHPDLFAAAGSYSGAVDTNYPPGQLVVEGEALADGARTPGAIWGQRVSDEVLWRTHNPYDLADNLRGMALSIRTGNGKPGPYDDRTIVDDAIEGGVHEMSESLHGRLDALGIPHLWDDYGPGTHSWPYWQRDLRADLPRFMATFAHPKPPPSPFTYRSAEASYDVFGWHVGMQRAVTEFSALTGASARGFTLHGSGAGTVTTAKLYEPSSAHPVTIGSGPSRTLRADRQGRLRIQVPLGPSNTGQQYRAGTLETKVFSTRVAIAGGRPKRACLARRVRVGARRIGRVRLGATRRQLRRLAPAPRRRTRRAWSWCVKRSPGKVRAVFSPRGRVALVVTTAHGHTARGVRPGSRTARRPGVHRIGPRGRKLVGVRRGRVRFVAVASPALLHAPKRLGRYLRAKE